MGKYISTIIITIIFSIIILLYGSAFLIPIFGIGNSMVKLLLSIIVLPFIALVGALIYNMYERIKEIKEEDKDDISKY
ncbi:TPA: hypothetical protein ACXDAY_002877 [Clostridium botulinum]|uniref:hypothetical protein n=1 Tax=Clostridium botulinum TaxID=1491 RepID=UPI00016B9A22|nr:hypothetical protein [Clostridium botulinum]APH24069.1 putative membrane protein [Clostridium botulinum]APQ68852.1 putative membrane protein [Clostridium botulinum]EDT84044.1 hypothetical protein CBB_2064 [Clostridium botulinum Bf]EPS56362.1 hypothetical protein CLQ_12733 [Clostridium botulinum Af84]MBN3351797.1 hypothetical protein [Clostridium botulinum]